MLKDVARGFKYSLDDAFGILKRGNVRGALWRIYIRNLVSLVPNIISDSRAPAYVNGHDLIEDGFAHLKSMNDELLEQVKSYYLSEKKHIGDFENYATEMITEGVIRPEGIDLTNNRALTIKILNQPNLIPLVESHLGIQKENLCFYARVDASFAVPNGKLTNSGYDGALEFHRDIDSRKFVKIFYYLNDVNLNCGHHELYLGSHKYLPWELRPLKRYNKREIEQHLKEPCRLHQVTGKKGFSWIENTTTLHAGTIPTKGSRLILMMSFNDESAQAMHGKNLYKSLKEYLQ